MSEILLAKKIFSDGQVKENQEIVTKDGVIIAVRQARNYTNENTVDCLAPGFIDIHINGGEKYHFTAHPYEDAISDISDASLGSGACYVLPTLISAPWETIQRGIDSIRNFMTANPHKGVLGMHLEGPFLSPNKRGAHVEAFLRKPKDDEILALIRHGANVIRLITIAPELFTDRQVAMLHDAGIVVSLGHSNATYEEAKHAFSLGINTVTHLFNAMSPFNHREPGLAGAALDDANVFTPVIVDGIHCDFAAVRIAYKLKRKKFFLISDALFLNRKVKKFQWGEFDAVLMNNKYYNSDGNLAGSSISLGDAVRNVVNELRIPLAEAIEMVTTRPAAVLGYADRLGKIAPGYPAVFTTFDESLSRFEALALR